MRQDEDRSWQTAMVAEFGSTEKLTKRASLTRALQMRGIEAVGQNACHCRNCEQERWPTPEATVAAVGRAVTQAWTKREDPGSKVRLNEMG